MDLLPRHVLLLLIITYYYFQTGNEGDPERHGNGRIRRQQAGVARRGRQHLLLRPGLPVLHPATHRRQEEGERQDGRNHQVRDRWGG